MNRRTFLKRTGQMIAGAAIAPFAVAAMPAKIPVAQEPDVYFGTRIACHLAGPLADGTYYMFSPGATPADPLNIKFIHPEDFYK